MEQKDKGVNSDFLKKKENVIPESNRPNWDEYFMNIAEEISKRSLDANTNVGCVIVDKNNRIISTGYNSFPPGINDSAWPRDRSEKLKILKHKTEGSTIFTKNYDSTDEYIVTNYEVIGEVTKYDVISHAEENAIASHKGSLDDCTIYCTYLPCNVCGRLIITSGIKRLVYSIINERFQKSCAIAIQLFKEAGVQIIKHESEERRGTDEKSDSGKNKT